MFKKPVTYFFAGLLLAATFAFTATEYQVRKNTAETETNNGLVIFHQAKPVAEFEELGQVKLSGIASTQFSANRSRLILKAKKEYANADAVIIDDEGYRATVIKLK